MAAQNNLPSSIVVNQTYVIPKASQVLVVLINTTESNILIWQPLLATEIYEVELHPWQYYIVINWEGNSIKIGF